MTETERLRRDVEKFHKEQKELKKKYEDMWREELRQKGITMIESSDQGLTPEEKHRKEVASLDKPGTMSDGEATVVWIIAMIVSLLFKGGWALCILETIIWVKHITR